MAGEHFRGGRIAYRAGALIRDDNRYPGTTPVDVFFTQAALEVLTGAGKRVDSEPRQATVRYREWLSWRESSGWHVVAFKEVVVK